MSKLIRWAVGTTHVRGLSCLEKAISKRVFVVNVQWLKGLHTWNIIVKDIEQQLSPFGADLLPNPQRRPANNSFLCFQASNEYTNRCCYSIFITNFGTDHKPNGFFVCEWHLALTSRLSCGWTKEMHTSYPSFTRSSAVLPIYLNPIPEVDYQQWFDEGDTLTSKTFNKFKAFYICHRFKHLGADRWGYHCQLVSRTHISTSWKLRWYDKDLLKGFPDIRYN